MLSLQACVLFHLYFCASFIQSQSQLSFLCADLFGQSNNSMRRKSSFVQFVKSINPNFIQLQKLLRRNLWGKNCCNTTFGALSLFFLQEKFCKEFWKIRAGANNFKWWNFKNATLFHLYSDAIFTQAEQLPFQLCLNRWYKILKHYFSTLYNRDLRFPFQNTFASKLYFSVQIFCEHWLYGL